MKTSQLRKWTYFFLVGIRHQPLGYFYERYAKEYRQGIPPETTRTLLVKLLEHCKNTVPYYFKSISNLGESYKIDPVAYLAEMPILTKDIIRRNFDSIKSLDINRRHWYKNTSGGSTGDPVTFIQDLEYASRAGAIKCLYSKLVGKEIGESELVLWGSLQDITKGSERWQTQLTKKLLNTSYFNAFRMTTESMMKFIAVINAKPPLLILAYVDSIYEMANFVEREGLSVTPQNAIMTTAGVLYPAMREKLENVFQCPVYNRYGSREVGDIACEQPGMDGLWVAPWGNYVEIVDDAGNRVPDGKEGDILITSLTNYAMPLIRYRIGDQGILLTADRKNMHKNDQALQEVIGRTTDNIRTTNGSIVHGGYFRSLLYYKKWILKYQIVQKSYTHIVYRIVQADSNCPQQDLDEITRHVRLIMGDDCRVDFEFVEEILPTVSGKHRYVISEISR